ncbi:MAG: ATPase, T2SS/T4P/T4SS family, partial [Candidatus Micrarchaeaceae archaeon]
IDRLLVYGSTAQKLGFDQLRTISTELLAENGISEYADSISYLLAKELTGFGPISILMDCRNSIEEIAVNSPTSNIAVYSRDYGYCLTNMKFSSDFYMRFVFNRLIEHSDISASSSNPIVDSQTKEGFRVHMQLPPYAPEGPVASVRLREREHYNPARLISGRSTSAKEVAYLWMCIDANANIIISGAPASGKTSLLASLMIFARRNERILAIEEDSSELLLERDMPNLVLLRSSGKVSPSEQLSNALHMRPERLVVGEIRGPETSKLYSGANLGIPFLTTMHSNSDPSSLLARLKSKPMSVDDYMLPMTDVAVFMEKDSISRRISEIAEYLWAARGEIKGMAKTQMKILHISSHGEFDLPALSESKILRRYSRMFGITPKMAEAELYSRAEHLSKAKSNFSINEMVEWIRSYEQASI